MRSLPTVKIMISRILFLFLSFTLLLPVSTLHAQSVTIDNSEYRKKVMQYLASDYFISEGVGLKKVYIGQSVEQLIKQLGKPAKKKKQGIFTGLVIYSYPLDNETALQVGIKNSKVRAIALAGSISSQYTTIKGARFDMPVYEIINYYGGGTLKRNKLLYKSQGIRFDFKDGKLRVIRIFPRQ
ncbi:hypothetical protein BMS3Bbin11_01692 [bacterium BMS3Bbin11]|nr:hypothetical protein BMS3Abin11_00291 [bacterium BMS3Abin11]GBE46591.1 hypothetical protein BMS3Bbin11_01692 [bacterium BMS3Bbin11]GMT41197.1 MAG: hypothetical protein IEMM0001_1932 [bacterium]HDH15469.1 hypothetical protein [Gammaproteobacteria bacterium]HDZ79433.1 hypothetical protein [Gammaproteobacteria bacterium]